MDICTRPEISVNGVLGNIRVRRCHFAKVEIAVFLETRGTLVM